MSNDRQQHGLQGPVKSMCVETAEFEEHEKELVEKPWFSHTISFNQDGSIIESTIRNPDGSTWRTLNEYSDAGKLVATRTYDSADQLIGQVLYVHDSEGRSTAEQSIASDGGVITPITYEYDAVEVRVYDPDGILVRRVEITRDALGNPLQETQYTGDTFSFEQCSSDSCSLGEEASLTKEQRVEVAAELARMFPPGTRMSNHIHRYDENGRLIESKLTMMEMTVNHQIFKYDQVGNKSEELIYDEKDALKSRVIFTREYGEHGNWTTEVVSTVSACDAERGLSIPCNMTRRRITYY